MNSSVYEVLARSKLLHDLGQAFRDATGLSLKLVRSGEPRQGVELGKEENPFCALMATIPSACAACAETQRELQRLGRVLTPHEICCFAGMIDLAVPVVVVGQHVATLLGGQAFRQKPRRRQFERLAKQLRAWGMRSELSRIKEAYLRTPVISENQLKGAVRLLAIFAIQLAESADRLLVAARTDDPPSVALAKTFVRAHASERVSLGDAAKHVHLSRYYFCKVFKQATGMTFTEFVARVRVDNAKSLLGNPLLRITAVAERAGFNSISQFNRLFRRYAGSPPTAYRTSLRASLATN